MKSKKFAKKIVSAFTALTLLASSAASTAFAEDAVDQTISAKINKNTVNFNVSGDFLEQGISYSLVDSDGTVYATWSQGYESSGKTSYGYNLLKTDPVYVTVRDYVLGDEWLFGRPDSSYVKSFSLENDSTGYTISWQKLPETLTSGYVVLTKSYTVTEEVYRTISGVDYTMPAGKFALYVQSGYTESGDFARHLEIEDAGLDLYYKKYAGKITQFSDLSAGTYDATEYIIVYDRGMDFGGGASDIITVSDKAVEYVKVTQNISELTKGNFNTDGTCDYYGYHFDLDDTSLSENGTVCNLIIASGSIINVVRPDENGNVTFYLSKEDYMAHTSDSYYFEDDSSYGSSAGSTYRVRAGAYDTYVTSLKFPFEVPTSGITYYALPAGNYTLISNDENYYFENSAITIKDTTDIQKFNVVLRKKSTSGLEADTVYKQTTAVSNGYYNIRFVKMVRKSDVLSSSDMTYSITDGTTTKTGTSTSYYNTITANGEIITADDGYVFLAVIVTGVPASVSLKCTMKLTW